MGLSSRILETSTAVPSAATRYDNADARPGLTRLVDGVGIRRSRPQRTERDECEHDQPDAPEHAGSVDVAARDEIGVCAVAHGEGNDGDRHEAERSSSALWAH